MTYLEIFKGVELLAVMRRNHKIIHLNSLWLKTQMIAVAVVDLRNNANRCFDFDSCSFGWKKCLMLLSNCPKLRENLPKYFVFSLIYEQRNSSVRQWLQLKWVYAITYSRMEMTLKPFNPFICFFNCSMFMTFWRIFL